MPAYHHGRANPVQQLLTQTERLAGHLPDGRLALVFQGVTAVSLGAMTVMSVFDLIRDARKFDLGPSGHHHR